MNALAIDTNNRALFIELMHEDRYIRIKDENIKETSSALLPSIDSLLKEEKLSLKDLDFLSVTQGPASFTSLRVVYSCLKAFSFSCSLPLYVFPSIDIYLNDYAALPCIKLCAIYESPARYYAKIVSEEGITILETGDYKTPDIVTAIKKENKENNSVLLCGTDGERLLAELKDSVPSPLYSLPFTITPTSTILRLGRIKKESGEEGIKDFDAPLYIRPSFAESKAIKKNKDA